MLKMYWEKVGHFHDNSFLKKQNDAKNMTQSDICKNKNNFNSFNTKSIGGGTGGGRGASGPSTFQTGGAWPLHFFDHLVLK